MNNIPLTRYGTRGQHPETIGVGQERNCGNPEHLAVSSLIQGLQLYRQTFNCWKPIQGDIELIKVLWAPIGIPLEMARVYLEEEE